MKQHIDTTDLEKLSESGKERLREWWKPKKSDWWTDGVEEYLLCFAPIVSEKFAKNNNGHPLLNIGQMIEFLDYYDPDYGNQIDQHKQMSQDGNGYWHYAFTPSGLYESFTSSELCDALWSACVEILNKS